MKTNLIDNRQIRVFISSTFQDMQGERDYLMKRTFPLLRKKAAERDVTLTELDLRWGITEEESKSGKVVEICLREIENSIPFFIGIIGDRYGWVPNKYDLSEGVTNRFPQVERYIENELSVTEMEMQFGVLERDERINAYFYIKKGDWDKGERDDSGEIDNKESLELLKQKVRQSEYPCSSYSSYEDLGSQVEKAFLVLLDKLFPQGNLSEFEKERIGQRSFMNQLCQNFIRDEKYFEKLDKWMQDWDSHQLVITGASGLGKSALIANWVNDKLSDKNRDYNIIYHFTGNGGSESNANYVSKILSSEIKDHYGLKDGQIPKETTLEDLFTKTCTDENVPLLIVLDAINQISDSDNAKLLNWIPTPTHNIKILYSTLENDPTMDVFMYRKYPLLTLDPLSNDRRVQLVENYLKLYGKTLKPSQIQRIVDDNQCRNTLVLRSLLDELINYGCYERLDSKIDEFLSLHSVADFYQVLLAGYEHDFQDYGGDVVNHILSLIAVSRNGLTENEILTITGILPIYWSQLFCTLIKHLTIRDGRIVFAHGYMRQAVISRYLEGRGEYEGFLRAEIITLLGEENSHRSWAELSFQYDKTERSEELCQLIVSPKVFDYLYKNEVHSLTKYWNKLSSNTSHTIKECYEQISLEKKDDARIHILMLSLFCCDYMSECDFSVEILTKALELSDKPEDQADIYYVLGYTYFMQYDYIKAIEYEEKSLGLYQSIHGHYHKDVATCYSDLGLFYSNINNYEKGLELSQKALDIKKNLKEYDEVFIAESLINIGFIYFYQGEYQLSIGSMIEAKEICLTRLGKIHPTTATCINNIGSIYSKLGDDEKAIQFLVEALNIRLSLYGENHALTAASFSSVGQAYANRQQFNEAEYYLKMSVDLRRELLGATHPKTTESLVNLTEMYVKKGDFHKAIECEKMQIETNTILYGEYCESIAVSYNNIGSDYLAVKEYDAAITFKQKALQIANKIGDCNLQAIFLNRLGQTYEVVGNRSNARECYLKAAEQYSGMGNEEEADTNRNEAEKMRYT